jgi:hypothetical protein
MDKKERNSQFFPPAWLFSFSQDILGFGFIVLVSISISNPTRLVSIL